VPDELPDAAIVPDGPAEKRLDIPTLHYRSMSEATSDDGHGNRTYGVVLHFDRSPEGRSGENVSIFFCHWCAADVEDQLLQYLDSEGALPRDVEPGRPGVTLLPIVDEPWDGDGRAEGRRP